MQRRAAQAWMTQFLSSDPPGIEDIESALEDFGFYHGFSDVARMYAEHENHGNLGYEGGVLDQPPEFWADLSTMKWLELWVKHVKDMPRLQQVSVFDQLRETGRFGSDWLTNGSK